jgi:hypothetical protein
MYLYKTFCIWKVSWPIPVLIWTIPYLYEGRLKSSWTHLITSSRNFVQVRWRFFFRSTSLGKRCTSYNAPLSYRKRAADRHHFEISCLGAPFSWLEKPRNRKVTRSELNSVFGLEKVDRWNPIRTSVIQSRSPDFEVINGLQHVFEEWVERCKKCITCQGRYFEKETVTAPPQNSDSGW